MKLCGAISTPMKNERLRTETLLIATSHEPRATSRVMLRDNALRCERQGAMGNVLHK